MELSVFPITQKEVDIRHLAFEKFGQYLIFFYAYDSNQFSDQIFYYKVWSIPDKRVIGGERQYQVGDFSTAPTGLNAYSDGATLWLGVTSATDIRVEKFNPLEERVIESWKPTNPIPGIRRFVLLKDRVFYTTGGSIQSQVYDPTSTDKASANDITAISGPIDDTLDFSNTTLRGFSDWVDFTNGDESFKVIWSVQTGYFVINQNNRIVAHLYGNLTPLTRTNRVSYYGRTVMIEDKVYLPILRSGQIEVVNRDAIVDRIVPQGQQLAGTRPLGLELLEIDLATENPPQVEQLDQQMLISGPVLNWTDGQSLSEYSFTEKPVITESNNVNYDRWPYSSLDITLPEIGELNRTRYNEITIDVKNRKAPYLVETVSFTAKISGDQTGATDDASWASTATTANRTLRIGTDLTNGNPSSDEGVLSRVYYDASDKAIVAEFTGVKALVEGRDYPQAILVNNVRYNGHYWDLTAGTLKLYHFRDVNPFSSGGNYAIKVPQSDVVVSTDSPQDIQLAETDNRNTNIKLDEVRLRRYREASVNDVLVRGTNVGFIQTSLAYLNQQRDVGWLDDPAIRDNVGVRPNDLSLIPWTRDSGGDRLNNYYDIIEDDGDRTQQGDYFIFGGEFNLYGMYIGSRRDNRVYVSRYPIRGGRPSAPIRASTLLKARGSFHHTETPIVQSNENLIWIGSKLWGTSETSNFDYRCYRDTATGLQRVAANDFDSNDQINFYMANTFYSTNGSAFSRSGRVLSRSTGRIPVGSGESGTLVGFKGLNDRIFSIAYPSGELNAFSRSGGVWSADGGFEGTLDYTPIANIASFQSGKFGYGRTAVIGNNVWFMYQTRSDSPFPNDSFIERTHFIKFARNEITTSTGSSSVTLIRPNVDMVGLWTTGTSGKLYMLFKGPTVNWSSPQTLDTYLQNEFKEWEYELGTNRYRFVLPSGGFSAMNKTFYTIGNNQYVRYEVPAWLTSSNLRDIVLDVVARSPAGLRTHFATKDRLTYVEILTDTEPAVFSAVYSSFDENGDPKTINNTQVNSTLIFFLADNRVQSHSFFLSDRAFTTSKGPVATNSYYYFATEDNPLSFNSEVFKFMDTPPELIVRYPLIEVQPNVSAAIALTANVYNYKCQYKWQDENGLEHRSQFSDPIQLISNSPIGQAGNQPTLNINNLSLSNKPPVSVGIEIYRTKNKSRTFQLLKEIPNNLLINQTLITDDVVDDDLGRPAGPDNALLSGAKYVVNYKGRFVLYGFPEKPNRLVVSSQRMPFTNNAITFARESLIELLMEQPIVSIQPMDNNLLIFCTNKCFVWSINETTNRQVNPSPVTGLAGLTADSFNASIEISDGVMFNAQGGQGIHLVTRGLQWNYSGEPVKNFFNKDQKILDICEKKDSEDIIFILKNRANTNDPKIVVYNQRYKQWSSWTENNIVSCVVWEGKFTALTETGEIMQEEDRV